MAKYRAFTYNTSVVPIGLTQIGNIHVSGVGCQNVLDKFTLRIKEALEY